MAYPLNVKTRLVSFGGAATVEAGIPLHIRISTESSRSLIWVEDGYRLESLAALYMSATDGQEIVFEVPTTDQNGWLDAATRQAIIVNPGEASHLYTTKLEIFTEDHELIRTYEIGPYAVPEGPGTLDADLLNPNYDPIEGTLTVYIPGPDGELSAAGQQAAADAIQAAIDAEGYRDQAETFSATTVELQDTAVATLIDTQGSATQAKLNDTFVAQGIEAGVQRLAATLEQGTGDSTVAIISDSTNDVFDEGFGLAFQRLADERPWLTLDYYVWADGTPSPWTDTTSGAYGTKQTYQTGVPGETRARLWLDSFARTGELNGSNSTPGHAARSWTAVPGRWASASGHLEAVTAGDGAYVTLPSNTEVKRTIGAKITMDQTTATKAVSFGPGGSTLSDLVRVFLSNNAGAWSWKIQKRIDDTYTDISAWEPIDGVADGTPTLNVTITMDGTSIVATANGAVKTAVLASGDVAKINGDMIPLGSTGAIADGTGTQIRDMYCDIFGVRPVSTLTLYFAAKAGSGFYYQVPRITRMLPVAPDVAVFSSVHNYASMLGPAYLGWLQQAVDAVHELHPDAALVMSSQNPKLPPQTLTHQANHRDRNRAIRDYARYHGYGYVPVFEKFNGEGPEPTRTRADGIHPTYGDGDAYYGLPVAETGAWLWSEAFFDYFETVGINQPQLNARIGDAIRAFSGAPAWAAGSRTFDPRLNTYNLRPDNLSKWRAGRARAAGGLGSVHISCFLDSIMYGAAGSGVSEPKPINAIYGRLRRMLDEQYGSAGSGIVVPWDRWYDTPSHDPRLVMTGDISKVALGAHGSGAIRWLDGDGANYVEFTETCTEFVLYTLNGGSRPRVQVDGGDLKYIAGTPNLDPSLTDYDPEPGYQQRGDGLAGQIVTRIPAGALGEHTLRILAPSNGAQYVVLAGVEAITGSPGVRVTGMARSGISTVQLVLDETSAFLTGMPVSIDMTKADLAVMLLGMNDYQAHYTPSDFKDRVRTVIQRQRSDAPMKANGDVLLVTCPQPNYAYPVPADGVLTPPLSEYFTALYELADEEDVPLLDLAQRWTDFDTSDALGYFGDPLHPSDLGSEDAARAISNALMAV